MIADLAFLQAIGRYCETRASLLVLVMAPSGTIRWANAFAGSRLGGDRTGQAFGDQVLDFAGTFDLSAVIDDPSSEHLLSFDRPGAAPRSYLFTFQRVGETVLALGRLEPDELEMAGEQIHLLNQELSNMTRQLHQRNARLDQINRELQAALAQVKTLRGLLPICAHCKQIRDDKGYWHQLETYLQTHSDITFSHGICRTCAEKYYPDYDLYDDPDDGRE